jgi:hypothetical protein
MPLTELSSDETADESELIEITSGGLVWASAAVVPSHDVTPE